jgi:hypothetical protein
VGLLRSLHTRWWLWELSFFFQGYVLGDVSGSQKKGQAAYNAVGTDAEDANPHCHGDSKLLNNYSRTTLLSTGAKLDLNKRAILHRSASTEILLSTTAGDGAAPSNTTSLRCVHRHQQTKAAPVQKSWASSLPPTHAWSQETSLASWLGKRDSAPHQRKQCWKYAQEAIIKLLLLYFSSDNVYSSCYNCIIRRH